MAILEVDPADPRDQPRAQLPPRHGTTLGAPAPRRSPRRERPADSESDSSSSLLTAQTSIRALVYGPAPANPTPLNLVVAEEAVNGLEPRKAKKRWVPNRDSLAKRMSIGKAGSRRRRRHDHSTFKDNPIVKLLAHEDPSSLHPLAHPPGPAIPRPPTAFSTVPLNATALIVNASTDQPGDAAFQLERREVHSVGLGHLTREDRRLRGVLRRTGGSVEFIREVEGVIRRAVSDSGSSCSSASESEDDEERLQKIERPASDSESDEPPAITAEGWTVIPSPKPTITVPTTVTKTPANSFLRLHISNTFLRLITHTLCKYYALASHSKCHVQSTLTPKKMLKRLLLIFTGSDEADGKRYTYISTSRLPGSCHPARTFMEYVFA
ncbi:hypothetical protein DFS34DRAFT_588835 [Phlyctochytrium arcticum]|nr:hypothetical protein DFS34DRAFT_588835 [Phlyctochytrium arcticum]